MNNSKELALLISAYADGELDHPSTTTVESRVAVSAEARRVLAIHRNTSMLLRAALPANRYMNRPADVPSFTARRRPRLPWYGQAVAASLVAGIAGFGTSTTLPESIRPAQAHVMTEVAEYHAVYSRETAHLVEVPASQADHLKAWLGRKVNRRLEIPDLRDSGLKFAGGRMLVLGRAPVAELMYTREDGMPIAICVRFRKGMPAPITLDRRDAMTIATWNDHSHEFFVVGEAEATLIHDIATVARRQI